MLHQFNGEANVYIYDDNDRLFLIAVIDEGNTDESDISGVLIYC